MVKIEVITMLLPVENTTDALNTQSQELYKSSQSEKGFTPTINKALMRRRKLIVWIYIKA